MFLRFTGESPYAQGTTVTVQHHKDGSFSDGLSNHIEIYQAATYDFELADIAVEVYDFGHSFNRVLISDKS